MSQNDPIRNAKDAFDVAGRNLQRYEQCTTPAGRASEMAGFDVAIRTAQVAATIALAEEQRTANLIAWYDQEPRQDTAQQILPRLHIEGR